MSLEVEIVKECKGFTLRVAFCAANAPMAILGASGSGKSMTLRCIAGIETPTSGRICLNGRVLFDSVQEINLSPQQRHVGYLFQNYALFPHMTVQQNIACGASGSKGEVRAMVQAQLHQFELDGLAKRYPAQLSGGQQQRVALARIFANKPEALLLDEPFSALDAHLRERMQLQMIELLGGYAGDALLVTHNRDEAYQLCSRLLILQAGASLEQGDTKPMFQNPRSLATARLTGCKNISTIRRVDETTLMAEGWGVSLKVAEKIPPNCTHVGVRAHSFKPAQRGDENAIPVCVRGKIESPFEWKVLFKNPRQSDADAREIWWKYGKAEKISTQPQFLAVAPHDILLLQEP